jgi:hypothetical protein
MGFSYFAIGGTQAHKHSNNSGDGGGLDQTTAFKSGSLIAWLLGM